MGKRGEGEIGGIVGRKESPCREERGKEKVPLRKEGVAQHNYHQYKGK